MTEAEAVVRARHALARGSWAEVYESLAEVASTDLSAEDLETLAEAAWWSSRYEETIAARQKAYAAYLTQGRDIRAARMSWHLFYDHLYRGEAAVALGWLRRTRRHLDGVPECAEHCRLALAESELALTRGDLAAAEAHAASATELGHRFHDSDGTALALESHGRILIRLGDVAEGCALLDEAMTLVVAGQVSAFFTGAVYCAVIAACRDVADVRRAREWTAAAMAWCDSLPLETPFHGICRVHRGELLGLLGAWDEAESETLRACDELLRYSPLSAAEAFTALAEIRRRRGDVVGAEDALRRANELGGAPQPTLALLRLAEGRVDVAAASLRSALADRSVAPMLRARLLAAQVDVAVAARTTDVARSASRELSVLAGSLDCAALHAMAAAARGLVSLEDGDPAQALEDLRRACAIWRELGLPYEEARTRLLAGSASNRLGDEEGARLELEAARATFESLGADADAGEASAAIDRAPSTPARLTSRELQVLRLVARGHTNRGIAAALGISEHTVARHVQNIFTKIGVSSRTAATAFAFDHELA